MSSSLSPKHNCALFFLHEMRATTQANCRRQGEASSQSLRQSADAIVNCLDTRSRLVERFLVVVTYRRGLLSFWLELCVPDHTREKSLFIYPVTHSILLGRDPEDAMSDNIRANWIVRRLQITLQEPLLKNLNFKTDSGPLRRGNQPNCTHAMTTHHHLLLVYVRAVVGYIDKKSECLT